ncbi:MAG: hypothetical protein J0M08_03075 [Bacteroidetes bacterium]|nr:hypothetical protein [Bacteroidota bacterium]
MNTSTIAVTKNLGSMIANAMSSFFKSTEINKNFTTSLIDSKGNIFTKSILFGNENILADSKLLNLKNSTYINYPVLQELSEEGFYVGAITDFMESDSAQGCSIGEAFIVGKEGYILKINYEVSDVKKQYFSDRTTDLRENTIGVLNTTIPFEIDSKETFISVFKYLLPVLKRYYTLQVSALKN